MKRPRWAIISALLLFALILGGCINIKQEYWMKADGSASISMDIGMSSALLSMGNGSTSSQTSPFDDLKKEFNTSNPNIKNVKTSERTEKDMQYFTVSFDVTNFEAFLKSQTGTDNGFDITITHQPNGNIIFKQITKLDTGTSSQTSGFDANTMGPMFKDMYWTVIVHVPEVVSTNGTKVDNGTAQWKIPMIDVFTGKAPGNLTVEYKPTGGGLGGGVGDMSWLIWVLVILFVLLIAGLAVYFLVLRKRPAPAMGPLGAPMPGGRPAYPPQPSGFPPQPQYSPQGGPMPPQGGPMPPQGGPMPPQGGQPQYQPPFQQAGQPPFPGQMPPQGGQMPPQQWGPTAPQGGQPQYPPAYPQPGQFPQGGQPQYPGYPQAPQYPPYPPQGGQPQYPPSGGYPPAGGYPLAGGYPAYPTYPQQGNVPPQQPPAAPPQSPPPDEPSKS